jgi:hypothetical protein
VQLVSWIFACLLLIQAGLVPASTTATEVADKYSKWNPSRITVDQPAALIQRGQSNTDVWSAWQRLEKNAGGELSVSWDLQTRTPQAIYGPMADVSAYGGDSEMAARDFLAEHAALFKLGAVAELRLIKRTESVGGAHVFFQQTYQGLPVHGGHMGVHINRGGQVHAVVSSYVPNVQLASIQPGVSSESVLERMLVELGPEAGRSLIAAPRRAVVVYVAADGAHLAWQITMSAREPLGTWEAFWDAHTGARLSPLIDRNYYLDGAARVFITNAVVATGNNKLSDERDSPNGVPDGAYTPVILTRLNNTGFLTGPFVNTSLTADRVNRPDYDFSDLNRGDDGFEEVMAYWAIDSAQQYIHSFGVLAAANYSIGVDVHGTTVDNSFFIPVGDGTGRLMFGDGGVDDAEDAEIIWHEYGHAILENQVPDINQNFDGMGEGWGDYWAATMSTRYASADHEQYDPAVGEWDATSYNPGNPPYLRRVDADVFYPKDRASDPHVTGMIWSAALWAIHKALGPEVADRIFLEGNFLMPFSPTLPEAAQAMLEADRNLNNGVNNAVMATVFSARGLLNVAAQGRSDKVTPCMDQQPHPRRCHTHDLVAAVAYPGLWLRRAPLSRHQSLGCPVPGDNRFGRDSQTAPRAVM